MRQTITVANKLLSLSAAALMLTCLLAGCENKSSNDEAREKVIKALNTFQEKRKAIVDYSNSQGVTFAPDVMREIVSRWEAIDPYYPLGVDSECAAAILRYKQAEIAWAKAFSPGSGADNAAGKAVIRELDAAKANFLKVRNDLANKYHFTTKDE